ncbi:MAG: hypothetical protein IPI19_02405 [Ignavibacteriales bacterium]|nr:hypothetical protein [Ignavibacteriales bacterium]
MVGHRQIFHIVVQYSYITPVELTSFAATTDSRNVTLNWSTATELNNSGFQVERSNGTAYEVVGFVAGHGTTTSPKLFICRSECDASSLNSGVYFYRIDADGIDGQKFSSVKKMILTK